MGGEAWLPLPSQWAAHLSTEARKTPTLPIWRNAPKSTGLSQALLLTPIVGRAWSASAGSLPPNLNSHHLRLQQQIVRPRPVALIVLAQHADADFQLSHLSRLCEI